MKPTARHRLRSISSRSNSLVKDLRVSFARSQPDDAGHIAIEGVHMIEEAVRSGLRLHAVFFSESAANRSDRLLPQLGAHVETLLLPDAIFSSAVATETPQGVAALVAAPQFSLTGILSGPAALVLVAMGVQDPGNLGTMLRSAEAFAASGVLLTEGTVSAYNSKVVRASAGSLFRVPIVALKFAEALPLLRERGLRLLATSTHKGAPLHNVDLAAPAAVLIGNEGAGLPREALSQADELITIPHSAKVESLNAAVAASVILYEASRQRGMSS